METFQSFTEKLGLTAKQPEQVSWCLNIINCSQNILTWIKENPWSCVCLLLVCVFLIWFCRKYNVNVTKKKKPRINKTENFCRTVVEKMFNQKFPSVRPDWLNNQKTQKNMEIDMYNEKLKLGFEYNGVQHYEYNKFFHKSFADFEAQVERDKAKKEICEQNGVKIIYIPYHIKKDRIKDFIVAECKKEGVPLPK